MRPARGPEFRDKRKVPLQWVGANKTDSGPPGSIHSNPPLRRVAVWYNPGWQMEQGLREPVREPRSRDRRCGTSQLNRVRGPESDNRK